MFASGFSGKAKGVKPFQMVRTRAPIDPVTTQDALGASTKLPGSQPIYRFASGHKPRPGLKALGRVRRGIV